MITLMPAIKKYYLHKDNPSKLHFEIFDAAPYLEDNSPAFKAHAHSFYQLIWFKEAGQHYVDYEVIPHPANSVFFLSPNQVHYFCRQSPNSGQLIHFDEIFLHVEGREVEEWINYKLFNGFGAPFVCLSDDDVKDFLFLIDLLQKETKTRAYNYRKQIFHLFQGVLLKIERLKHGREGIRHKEDPNFKVALEFKRLIGREIENFLTVEDACKALGISRQTQVIHERKILEAKRLLSNLRLSIKEIAFRLGFDQPTYFTKYFKKHTGLTPRAFIKQLP